MSVLYLKAFDLDLPYIINDKNVELIMKEENCEYYDATKKDYELNWKSKRRSFSLETRCITAMFERLFGKQKTKDCWKILVDCVENISDERIINNSGVCVVQIKFNLDDFSVKNETEKKRTTLQLLMNGIEKLVSDKNWDITPFKETALKIEELGYVNEWVWKKVIKSPKKNYSAKVICQHNVESMDIYLSIMNRDGTQILLEKVISELPNEFAYARHLGELKWISDSEVALIDEDNDGMVSINLEKVK